ncbi:DUF4286 family protein [Enterovirga aerilata]|uniref:Uncharacterized protein n=1 Tax=Enterovirga aerilata TaxID=2730920 RepID=A0A849IHS6_9HYPH|nr:DUF4286 family protein [Enterovirga sp. DB1703]NNM73483.1 hypothetical protein [Enterovirga sp. DB1703]
MPIAGKGMLITWMDVDPADEADFNLWYDREHLAERVAIEGFMEARRWIAVQAGAKYFNTYSTQSFETLSSPAYKQVLANQTAWSNKHISRFRNPGRVIGRISHSRGQGRGGALGVVRLRPAADGRDAARTGLLPLLDPGMLPGIVSLHLVESDPELSRTLTDPDTANPGAADWYVLIDGTDVGAVTQLVESRFQAAGIPVVATGTYRLLWDLVKGEL